MLGESDFDTYSAYKFLYDDEVIPEEQTPTEHDRDPNPGNNVDTGTIFEDFTIDLEKQIELALIGDFLLEGDEPLFLPELPPLGTTSETTTTTSSTSSSFSGTTATTTSVSSTNLEEFKEKVNEISSEAEAGIEEDPVFNEQSKKVMDGIYQAVLETFQTLNTPLESSSSSSQAVLSSQTRLSSEPPSTFTLLSEPHSIEGVYSLSLDQPDQSDGTHFYFYYNTSKLVWPVRDFITKGFVSAKSMFVSGTKLDYYRDLIISMVDLLHFLRAATSQNTRKLSFFYMVKKRIGFCKDMLNNIWKPAIIQKQEKAISSSTYVDDRLLWKFGLVFELFTFIWLRVTCIDIHSSDPFADMFPISEDLSGMYFYARGHRPLKNYFLEAFSTFRAYLSNGWMNNNEGAEDPLNQGTYFRQDLKDPDSKNSEYWFTAPTTDLGIFVPNMKHMARREASLLFLCNWKLTYARFTPIFERPLSTQVTYMHTSFGDYQLREINLFYNFTNVINSNDNASSGLKSVLKEFSGRLNRKNLGPQEQVDYNIPWLIVSERDKMEKIVRMSGSFELRNYLTFRRYSYSLQTIHKITPKSDDRHFEFLTFHSLHSSSSSQSNPNKNFTKLEIRFYEFLIERGLPALTTIPEKQDIFIRDHFRKTTFSRVFDIGGILLSSYLVNPMQLKEIDLSLEAGILSTPLLKKFENFPYNYVPDGHSSCFGVNNFTLNQESGELRLRIDFADWNRFGISEGSLWDEYFVSSSNKEDPTSSIVLWIFWILPTDLREDPFPVKICIVNDLVSSIFSGHRDTGSGQDTHITFSFSWDEILAAYVCSTNTKATVTETLRNEPNSKASLLLCPFWDINGTPFHYSPCHEGENKEDVTRCELKLLAKDALKLVGRRSIFYNNMKLGHFPNLKNRYLQFLLEKGSDNKGERHAGSLLKKKRKKFKRKFYSSLKVMADLQIRQFEQKVTIRNRDDFIREANSLQTNYFIPNEYEKKAKPYFLSDLVLLTGGAKDKEDFMDVDVDVPKYKTEKNRVPGKDGQYKFVEVQIIEEDGDVVMTQQPTTVSELSERESDVNTIVDRLKKNDFLNSFSDFCLKWSGPYDSSVELSFGLHVAHMTNDFSKRMASYPEFSEFTSDPLDSVFLSSVLEFIENNSDLFKNGSEKMYFMKEIERYMVAKLNTFFVPTNESTAFIIFKSVAMLESVIHLDFGVLGSDKEEESENSNVSESFTSKLLKSLFRGGFQRSSTNTASTSPPHFTVNNYSAYSPLKQSHLLREYELSHMLPLSFFIGSILDGDNTLERLVLSSYLEDDSIKQLHFDKNKKNHQKYSTARFNKSCFQATGKTKYPNVHVKSSLSSSPSSIFEKDFESFTLGFESGFKRGNLFSFNRNFSVETRAFIPSGLFHVFAFETDTASIFKEAKEDLQMPKETSFGEILTLKPQKLCLETYKHHPSILLKLGNILKKTKRLLNENMYSYFENEDMFFVPPYVKIPKERGFFPNHSLFKKDKELNNHEIFERYNDITKQLPKSNKEPKERNKDLEAKLTDKSLKEESFAKYVGIVDNFMGTISTKDHFFAHHFGLFIPNNTDDILRMLGQLPNNPSEESKKRYHLEEVKHKKKEHFRDNLLKKRTILNFSESKHEHCLFSLFTNKQIRQSGKEVISSEEFSKQDNSLSYWYKLFEKLLESINKEYSNMKRAQSEYQHHSTKNGEVKKQVLLSRRTSSSEIDVGEPTLAPKTDLLLDFRQDALTVFFRLFQLASQQGEPVLEEEKYDYFGWTSTNVKQVRYEGSLVLEQTDWPRLSTKTENNDKGLYLITSQVDIPILLMLRTFPEVAQKIAYIRSGSFNMAGVLRQIDQDKGQHRNMDNVPNIQSFKTLFWPLFQELKMGSKKQVLTPFNTSDANHYQHWILLIFYYDKSLDIFKCIVVDSLYSAHLFPNYGKQVLNLVLFLNNRNDLNYPNPSPQLQNERQNFLNRCMAYDSTFSQKDSINCGIFVIVRALETIIGFIRETNPDYLEYFGKYKLVDWPRSKSRNTGKHYVKAYRHHVQKLLTLCHRGLKRKKVLDLVNNKDQENLGQSQQTKFTEPDENTIKRVANIVHSDTRAVLEPIASHVSPSSGSSSSSSSSSSYNSQPKYSKEQYYFLYWMCLLTISTIPVEGIPFQNLQSSYSLFSPDMMVETSLPFLVNRRYFPVNMYKPSDELSVSTNMFFVGYECWLNQQSIVVGNWVVESSNAIDHLYEYINITHTADNLLKSQSMFMTATAKKIPTRAVAGDSLSTDLQKIGNEIETIKKVERPDIFESGHYYPAFVRSRLFFKKKQQPQADTIPLEIPSVDMDLTEILGQEEIGDIPKHFAGSSELLLKYQSIGRSVPHPSIWITPYRGLFPPNMTYSGNTYVAQFLLKSVQLVIQGIYNSVNTSDLSSLDTANNIIQTFRGFKSPKILDTVGFDFNSIQENTKLINLFKQPLVSSLTKYGLSEKFCVIILSVVLILEYVVNYIYSSPSTPSDESFDRSNPPSEETYSLAIQIFWKLYSHMVSSENFHNTFFLPSIFPSGEFQKRRNYLRFYLQLVTFLLLKSVKPDITLNDLTEKSKGPMRLWLEYIIWGMQSLVYRIPQDVMNLNLKSNLFTGNCPEEDTLTSFFDKMEATKTRNIQRRNVFSSLRKTIPIINNAGFMNCIHFGPLKETPRYYMSGISAFSDSVQVKRLRETVLAENFVPYFVFSHMRRYGMTVLSSFMTFRKSEWIYEELDFQNVDLVKLDKISRKWNLKHDFSEPYANLIFTSHLQANSESFSDFFNSLAKTDEQLNTINKEKMVTNFEYIRRAKLQIEPFLENENENYITFYIFDPFFRRKYRVLPSDFGQENPTKLNYTPVSTEQVVDIVQHVHLRTDQEVLLNVIAILLEKFPSSRDLAYKNRNKKNKVPETGTKKKEKRLFLTDILKRFRLKREVEGFSFNMKSEPNSKLILDLEETLSVDNAEEKMVAFLDFQKGSNPKTVIDNDYYSIKSDWFENWPSLLLENRKVVDVERESGGVRASGHQTFLVGKVFNENYQFDCPLSFYPSSLDIMRLQEEEEKEGKVMYFKKVHVYPSLEEVIQTRQKSLSNLSHVFSTVSIGPSFASHHVMASQECKQYHDGIVRPFPIPTVVSSFVSNTVKNNTSGDPFKDVLATWTGILPHFNNITYQKLIRHIKSMGMRTDTKKKKKKKKTNPSDDFKFQDPADLLAINTFWPTSEIDLLRYQWNGSRSLIASGQSIYKNRLSNLPVPKSIYANSYGLGRLSIPNRWVVRHSIYLSFILRSSGIPLMSSLGFVTPLTSVLQVNEKINQEFLDDGGAEGGSGGKDKSKSSKSGKKQSDVAKIIDVYPTRQTYDYVTKKVPVKLKDKDTLYQGDFFNKANEYFGTFKVRDSNSTSMMDTNCSILPGGNLLWDSVSRVSIFDTSSSLSHDSFDINWQNEMSSCIGEDWNNFYYVPTSWAPSRVSDMKTIYPVFHGRGRTGRTSKEFTKSKNDNNIYKAPVSYDFPTTDFNFMMKSLNNNGFVNRAMVTFFRYISSINTSMYNIASFSPPRDETIVEAFGEVVTTPLGSLFSYYPLEKNRNVFSSKHMDQVWPLFLAGKSDASSRTKRPVDYLSKQKNKMPYAESETTNENMFPTYRDICTLSKTLDYFDSHPWNSIGNLFTFTTKDKQNGEIRQFNRDFYLKRHPWLYFPNSDSQPDLGIPCVLKISDKRNAPYEPESSYSWSNLMTQGYDKCTSSIGIEHEVLGEFSPEMSLLLKLEKPLIHSFGRFPSKDWWTAQTEVGQIKGEEKEEETMKEEKSGAQREQVFYSKPRLHYAQSQILNRPDFGNNNNYKPGYIHGIETGRMVNELRNWLNFVTLNPFKTVFSNSRLVLPIVKNFNGEKKTDRKTTFGNDIVNLDFRFGEDFVKFLIHGVFSPVNFLDNLKFEHEFYSNYFMDGILSETAFRNVQVDRSDFQKANSQVSEDFLFKSVSGKSTVADSFVRLLHFIVTYGNAWTNNAMSNDLLADVIQFLSAFSFSISLQPWMQAICPSLQTHEPVEHPDENTDLMQVDSITVDIGKSFSKSMDHSILEQVTDLLFGHISVVNSLASDRYNPDVTSVSGQSTLVPTQKSIFDSMVGTRFTPSSSFSEKYLREAETLLGYKPGLSIIHLLLSIYKDLSPEATAPTTTAESTATTTTTTTTTTQSSSSVHVGKNRQISELLKMDIVKLLIMDGRLFTFLSQGTALDTLQRQRARQVHLLELLKSESTFVKNVRLAKEKYLVPRDSASFASNLSQNEIRFAELIRDCLGNIFGENEATYIAQDSKFFWNFVARQVEKNYYSLGKTLSSCSRRSEIPLQYEPYISLFYRNRTKMGILKEEQETENDDVAQNLIVSQFLDKWEQPMLSNEKQKTRKTFVNSKPNSRQNVEVKNVPNNIEMMDLFFSKSFILDAQSDYHAVWKKDTLSEEGKELNRLVLCLMEMFEFDQDFVQLSKMRVTCRNYMSQMIEESKKTTPNNKYKDGIKKLRFFSEWDQLYYFLVHYLPRSNISGGQKEENFEMLSVHSISTYDNIVRGKQMMCWLKYGIVDKNCGEQTAKRTIITIDEDKEREVKKKETKSEELEEEEEEVLLVKKSKKKTKNVGNDVAGDSTKQEEKLKEIVAKKRKRSVTSTTTDPVPVDVPVPIDPPNENYAGKSTNKRKNRNYKTSETPRIYYSNDLEFTTSKKDAISRKLINSKVYVGKSTIPGAGLGLFAAEDLRHSFYEDEPIATYDGEIMTIEECSKRPTGCEYGLILDAFSEKPKWVVDAQNKDKINGSLGGYANDKNYGKKKEERDPNLNNAKLRRVKKGNSYFVYLVISKKGGVKKGQEIFLDYNKDDVAAKVIGTDTNKPQKKPTKEQKKKEPKTKKQKTKHEPEEEPKKRDKPEDEEEDLRRSDEDTVEF